MFAVLTALITILIILMAKRHIEARIEENARKQGHNRRWDEGRNRDHPLF